MKTFLRKVLDKVVCFMAIFSPAICFSFIVSFDIVSDDQVHIFQEVYSEFVFVLFFISILVSVRWSRLIRKLWSAGKKLFSLIRR